MFTITRTRARARTRTYADVNEALLSVMRLR